MKIELDTERLTALDREVLTMLLFPEGLPFVGERISHADNPSTGKMPVDMLPTVVAALGLPQLPSLELTADPKSVFKGDAAAPIPPAAASGGAPPPPPPMPPSVSPVPPVPGASSLPTAGAPPAPPAAPGASVELDTAGFPYDPRIHSSSKNKNADGKWRDKRNVDPALRETVVAQLRAVMAAPPPAASATPPAPPAPPAPPPAADAGDAPPTGNAAVVFGATPTAGAMGFPEMMVALTPLMTQGKVTTPLMTAACIEHGVPALPLLAARPDLVAAVYATILQKAALTP